MGARAGFLRGAGSACARVQLQEPLLASSVNKDRAAPTSFKGNIPSLQVKGGLRDEPQRGDLELGAHPACERLPPQRALPVTHSLMLLVTNPSKERSSRTPSGILATIWVRFWPPVCPGVAGQTGSTSQRGLEMEQKVANQRPTPPTASQQHSSAQSVCVCACVCGGAICHGVQEHRRGTSGRRPSGRQGTCLGTDG